MKPTAAETTAWEKLVDEAFALDQAHPYLGQTIDAEDDVKARKFSDDQPRDDHGRWGEGSGGEAHHEVLAKQAAAGVKAIEKLLPDAIARYGSVPSKWAWDSNVLSRTSVDSIDAARQDYARTGGVARLLVNARTIELMRERGISSDHPDYKTNAGFTIGDKVWSSWKDSSTSQEGLALQLATSKEFGAVSRLAPYQEQVATYAMRSFVTLDEWHAAREQDDNFDGSKMEALGLARLQAYTRAQWETTQFILSKAGVDKVESYRALMLPKKAVEQEKVQSEHEGALSTTLFQKLPEVQLQRNGLQSATADPEIANNWLGLKWNDDKKTKERVVVRYQAPREAVFSVPVFGQNHANEHEVVLLGAKSGMKWDAWKGKAPQAKFVPIKMSNAWL